jgi:hypothetical protein
MKSIGFLGSPLSSSFLPLLSSPFSFFTYFPSDLGLEDSFDSAIEKTNTDEELIAVEEKLTV